MMGPSHAATGAAAWLALTGWHSPVEALHLPAELQLLGALTTAGAALISAWDHLRASVAHALPPLTEWISRGVSDASGSHRQGTQSLLGIAAFTALAVVAAVLGTVLGDGLWWIPASVAIGVSAHILGDALTAVGVPLLWPLRPAPPVRTPLGSSSGRFSLPLLGATGSWREWLFVSVLTAFTVVRAVHLVPPASRSVVALL
ncbi:metal-dependent hydrolase [Micrococcus luteus]|nr:metal-dependent hydrolase [Micrococcus luteus]